MGTVLKRMTTVLLLLIMLIIMPVSEVHAEPQAEQTADNGAAQETELSDFEKQKQASYDTVPETNNIDGWPEGPKVYGNSAIVMDMNSGAILYGKKIDEQHYPASITKLLTVLIALENSSLDDEVLFSQESIDILRSDYASIGMRPGEILSMGDALYATMLASANEVAYAVGENVGKLMGGDYNTFIQAMNDRSTELGCTGSSWTNANGLHDDLHYTTARDMALITSALYEHEEFRTIAQTLSYTIGPTNLVNEQRVFQQHHKMLWPDNSNYYEYCTGGKTGYTDKSRTTLVTTADNGTLQLVAVVLQDDGDVYADTRSMFDYGFNNFSKVLLSGEKIPEEIRSYTDSDSYVLLPDGVTFDSLDHEITVEDEKEASGRITFFYKGQNVGSADVVLTPEYVEEATGYTTRLELSNPGAGQDMDTGKSSRALSLSMIMRIAAAGAVILLLFILIIIVVFRRRAAVRRKRRMMIRRKRHQMQMRQGTGRQKIRNVKRGSARARQPVSSNRNRRRS